MVDLSSLLNTNLWNGLRFNNTLPLAIVRIIRAFLPKSPGFSEKRQIADQMTPGFSAQGDSEKSVPLMLKKPYFRKKSDNICRSIFPDSIFSSLP